MSCKHAGKARQAYTLIYGGGTWLPMPNHSPHTLLRWSFYCYYGLNIYSFLTCAIGGGPPRISGRLTRPLMRTIPPCHLLLSSFIHVCFFSWREKNQRFQLVQDQDQDRNLSGPTALHPPPPPNRLTNAHRIANWRSVGGQASCGAWTIVHDSHISEYIARLLDP